MKLKDAVKKIGMFALIYGESGVGKTTLIGDLPGKTLLIAVENTGIISIAECTNAENIEVVFLPQMGDSLAENTDRLNKFFDRLATADLPYDNICIDSLTELASEMLMMRASPNKNDGMNAIKDYGAVQATVRRIIKNLKKVAVDKQKNIIMTALEYELELGQSENRRESKMHPNLNCGRGFPPKVEGEFDTVAHMERKADGTRWIRLDANEIFFAKDRYSRKFCAATGKDFLNANNNNEKKEGK